MGFNKRIPFSYKMNKKGFELSINFLIMLILAIVIFGFSVKFVYTIFDGLSELEQKNADKLDLQVKALQCGNEKVCPTIIQGGKLNQKDLKTYSFKILNVKLPAEKTDFRIELTQVVTPDGAEELFYPYKGDKARTIPLEPNEEKTIAIGVEIPKGAVSGKYAIDIEVTQNSKPYGKEKVNKLYVEVI